MKKAVKYKVSKTGKAITLFFDDNTTDTLNFDQFLKVHKNYTKAVYEYLTYLFVLCNNYNLFNEIKQEIKQKLLAE